jgi:hypothetical protein
VIPLVDRGELGSRASLRNARSSSPRIGCVAVDAFLTRRTAKGAASKSI